MGALRSPGRQPAGALIADCCSLLAPLSDLDAVETFTGMNAADMARSNGHFDAAQAVDAYRERVDIASLIPDKLLCGVLLGKPRI